jgi:hypothetical protein
MSALSRYLSLATVVLALGACDPRFVHKSDLSPREIGNLSGTWTGRGTLSFASKNYCPRVYLWTLHIGDGNVDGLVVDEQTPDAPPASFTSFVDYDGSLHADVRTKGHDFALLGTFNHSGFSGTARSDNCNYAVSLRHRGASS